MQIAVEATTRFSLLSSTLSESSVPFRQSLFSPCTVIGRNGAIVGLTKSNNIVAAAGAPFEANDGQGTASAGIGVRQGINEVRKPDSLRYWLSLPTFAPGACGAMLDGFAVRPVFGPRQR